LNWKPFLLIIWVVKTWQANMKNIPPHHGPKGFTLIELTIALVVLTMLSIFAGRIYLNYTNSSRDLKAANLVYDEARYLMERIVREVRQNGIDYEQYFNQNVMIPLNGGVGSYTDNYCSYSSFFYDNGLDGDVTTLEDNESRGTRNVEREGAIDLFFPPSPPNPDPAAAVKPIEKELYLINIGGNKRTILTRVEKTVGTDTIGKVAVLKLDGEDFGQDHIDGRNPKNDNPPVTDFNCSPDEGENDGLIDTWLCAPDFPCKKDVTISVPTNPLCEGYAHLAVNDPTNPNHSFVDISPNAINVVDLKFIIAPMDDPWKAYNMKDVQIQPHVTIQLTVESSPKLTGSTLGARKPSVTLTSTVTARNYSEITSDCLR
jgi:prepilin-type N-terminal cleavage/methylation domain-containing protein